MARPAPAPAVAMAADEPWRNTLLVVAGASVLALIAHRQTVMAAVHVWMHSQTYAFAWILLPVLAYLLWHNRAHLEQVRPAFSLAALAPAALGAALWLAGELANIALVREFALVASLCAIVFAAVGARAFRALLPYLAVLFYMVPAGDVLLEPLKTVAVEIVRTYSAVLGMPFEHDGFSMLIAGKRYIIIDDCAGLGYALAGSFIGLVLGLLIYRRLWRIAALSLAGGIAGVASNALRILTIITYDYLAGSRLSLQQHGYFEAPAVLLAFGSLLFVFSRLRGEGRAERDSATYGGITSSAGTRGASGGARAIATGLATLPIVLVSALSMEAAPTVHAPLVVPANISGWASEDEVPIDWTPHVSTAGVETLTATFRKDARAAALFIAQSNSRREKLSGAALDLAGSTEWLPALEERMVVCDGQRCLPVTHLKLLRRGSKRVRHLYAAYATGAGVVAAPLAFRLRRAWAILTTRGEWGRVIALASDAPHGLASAEVAALISALATRERPSSPETP
jgi:exosortase